jgi:hypothetical protein
MAWCLVKHRENFTIMGISYYELPPIMRSISMTLHQGHFTTEWVTKDVWGLGFLLEDVTGNTHDNEGLELYGLIQVFVGIWWLLQFVEQNN